MLTAWTIARARLAGSPDYEKPLSPPINDEDTEHRWKMPELTKATYHRTEGWSYQDKFRANTIY